MPDPIAMMSLNGYEVAGIGATATIYRNGDKALKVYVNAPFDEALNESERQRFAFKAGLPVPEVYGVRRFDENSAAFEMQYINGQPLIYPRMNKDERRGAIHTLVKLQREVHNIHAIGLPKQIDRLAWKIERARGLDEPVRRRLPALLHALDNGSDSLCHGDFHPQNIIYDGTKRWIIDWVDAAAGNPLADACRTYLIFLEHMKRSAGIYMKAFCEEAGVKPDDVLAWLPVTGAARLSENLEDKSRKWLAGVLNEWDFS